MLEGKRVVLIDDTIVRGTTSRPIVQLLRDAGAREVHMRVHAPPILWPCFMGVDFASRSELIAARLTRMSRRSGGRSASIRSRISRWTASSGPSANRAMASARACLTGEYPVPIYEDASKFALERTLLGAAD